MQVSVPIFMRLMSVLSFKLSKAGWKKEMLYKEYLNGKLIADSEISAPKVYEFVEIENRYGYTMEKLNDLTLLELMRKYPWKVIKYAKQMAAIHAQIHSVNAPHDLPFLADKYYEFISSKNDISDVKRRLIFQELEQFSIECKCCICHGDFHPINILVDGERYFVIDWVLATRGNPEADVAGTYLIIGIYSSSKGDKAFFEFLVDVLGGKLIAKVYLKEYIRITKMDKKKILRWIPIRAATYMDVGLPMHLDKKFKKILDKHYKA